MAEGCWEQFLTAVPLLVSPFTSARQQIQGSLRVWLGDKGGGVLRSVAECRPRVAIYLTNTAHTPKATILQQAWFCYSSVVKAEMMEPCRQTSLYSLEWKSDANREDFFLCVWVLSVDLLWYSAVVSDSDVSTKKGHCGIWKQLFSYFSLYLRSALRMPNCLLGCFHKSCHGAANPVFIHWLLALM